MTAFLPNGRVFSNLLTAVLELKNLPCHYQFCKQNESGDILGKEKFETPYVALSQLMEKHKELAEREALLQGQAVITYAEFKRQIDCLSAFFHFNWNMEKGENVSLCTGTLPEGIVCFFALNKLGLVNARIFNGSREEKMKNNLLDFQSELIFVDNRNLDTLTAVIKKTKVTKVLLAPDCERIKVEKLKSENSGVSVVSWEEALRAGSSERKEYIEKCSGNDLAAILYTSGSSGEPKPVVIANRVYVNMVEVVSRTTNVKKCGQEKVIGVVSQEYPYAAVNSTIMILLLGKTLILPEQAENRTALAGMLAKQPQRIQAIPNFYKLWQELSIKGTIPDLNLVGLKYIISGGETFLKEEKKQTLAFLRQNGINPLLIDGFGFSEMGSATALKFGLADTFLLMNGIEAKTLEAKTLSELPTGQEGILCFSGPTIAEGYFHNTVKTESSFFTDEKGKRWFVSDTYGTVCGRRRRRVRLGGRVREYFITDDGNGTFVKVYAGNVEEVIVSSGIVADCVVVPSDVSAAPKPVAYVVLKQSIDSQEQAIERIQKTCEDLECFARPDTIYLVDCIRRTDAGKKDYRYYRGIAGMHI